MKIVADQNIPFLRGVFDSTVEMLYLPGKEIRKEHLLHADGLLVRTRTNCDRTLLEGTGVRLIGTATIGFDHIDTAWCESNGITWSNAPGCNSGGVAQYITAALVEMAHRNQFQLEHKTLGIIGVGHVGKKVAKMATTLGMKVLLNDPPRERQEGGSEFTCLANLLRESDIITVHVPLNLTGPDRTAGMIGHEFLQQLRPGAILINSSRGEVLNEMEAVEYLQGSGIQLILDVWPHEPLIHTGLLRQAVIATPHIAGYSLDGKFNATRMMVDLVSGFFGIEPGEFKDEPKDIGWTWPDTASPALGVSDWIRMAYDINTDDRRLRESPTTFEDQRNHYPVRREFGSIILEPFPGGETGRILQGLGFKKIS